MKGAFFTGSDTGVGKTQILAAVCQMARSKKISVRVRKPVQSGVTDIRLSDAAVLHEASGGCDSLDTICPISFGQAFAPPVAARMHGSSLTFAAVKNAVGNPGDGLLVEGAGGFLSPIAEDALNAHLAVYLGLPVVVVVEHRLGCINQTLLTVEAVQSRGLSCAAVVLNRCRPGDTDDHARELRRWCSIPVISVQYVESQTKVWQALTPALASLFEILL